MAIKRPDIYEHNNPNNAISDSDFVRGGIRTKVPNLPALGALASKADQMKEYATFVWVESENKYYVLVDKNNIGNINGWSSTILTGMTSVTTDSTLQGDGSESDPLGLSDDKNAEIAGKIGKEGVNLLDSGNIPEMKGGAISGIYRGNYGSNPVYVYSPFFQMTTADTFAQIHIWHENGEMSYRAGTLAQGYSALRTSWDNVNLPSPATQTQLATKQDKSLFSALVDKWINFYDSATAKMQPIIKLVTGAINQLEFDGRMKIAALILPANSNPAVANEFKSNGSRLIFANNSAVESTVAYTSDLPTTFVYTPTGNFTTSQLKAAAENAGLIFNGLHFIIKIGTNNYTCTVDNGASNSETVITFGKRGTTGSISFIPNAATPSRILNAGADNITVMNGNVNSLAMLNFDTSVDFLTIYNNQ